MGGCMRADGWSRMPLVRMTNLHLEPGEGSFEELLEDVDDGLYMETNKSWSIDDKRLNFQFGTQIAWEIKNGKLGADGARRDVHGRDADLLGEARRGRRPGGVAALRAHELRQGPARPGGARVARRVPGPVPGRRGGRLGVSRALEIAERALGAVRGDEAEVLVHAERSGVARFAASIVHQPTLIDNAVVRARVVRDGKIGWRRRIAATTRAWAS